MSAQIARSSSTHKQSCSNEAPTSMVPCLYAHAPSALPAGAAHLPTAMRSTAHRSVLAANSRARLEVQAAALPVHCHTVRARSMAVGTDANCIDPAKGLATHTDRTLWRWAPWPDSTFVFSQTPHSQAATAQGFGVGMWERSHAVTSGAASLWVACEPDSTSLGAAPAASDLRMTRRSMGSELNPKRCCTISRPLVLPHFIVEQ